MKKLGTLLQEANAIDEIQLVAALSHQRKWKCRLGKSLVELGFVSEATIAQTVAHQVGVRFIELDPTFTPRELFKMVPKWLADEKKIFPVGYSTLDGWKAVIVAFGDPTDYPTVESIGKHTGMKVQVVVALESAIEDAVSKWDSYAASNPIGGGDIPVQPPPAQLFKQAVSAVTPSSEDYPAIAPESALPSNYAPQPATPQPEADEIVSINDLPSIEDFEPAPETPPYQAPEPESAPEQPAYEPSATDTTEQAPEEMPEIDHSQPWENIMPEMTPESDTPAIPPEESIAAPEDFIAPAYEQLEPPQEPAPAPETPDYQAPEVSEAPEETPEESFASSPSRPNTDNAEPVNIQSLETLIPSTGAPQGNSLMLPAAPVPVPAQEAPAEPHEIAPPLAAKQRESCQVGADEALSPVCAEQVLSDLDVFAVAPGVSNEDILREIKYMRQEIEVISSLLKSAIKKMSKN